MKYNYNLYDQYQMTENYKLNEIILNRIFKNKIKCGRSNENLKLNEYYKT